MSNGFGFGRPRSSDSWSTRRSAMEFSSRMHSVPRHSKSNTKYNGSPYASEFVFDGSRPHYESLSMAASNRSSFRSFDRAKPPRHDGRSKDLKRKMVFNLHEEVGKPIQTISLEEISDADTITDICLNTLTSMMKSRLHKKFLYHMNNSALVDHKQVDNRTHNNKNIEFRTEDERKDSSKQAKLKTRSDIIAIFEDIAGSQDYGKVTSEQTETVRVSIGKASHSSDAVPAPNNPKGLKGMPMDYDDYSKQATQSRKKRQGEISALKRLTTGLPPTKKKLNKQAIEEQNNPEPIMWGKPGTSSPRHLKSPSVEVEEATDVMDAKKQQRLVEIQNILKCKWLRLTKEQINFLENELRANGIDPTLHAHSPAIVDVRSVFN